MGTVKKAELEAQLQAEAAQKMRLEKMLAAEKAFLSNLVEEYNSIIHMLNEVFSLQVGAKDFEGDAPLWDVTDTRTGAVLVHHEKDAASAYRQAILQQCMVTPPKD